MIRSFKQVSKLNNSIQGAITCNNLTIDNNLISNQVAYNRGLTGVTGPTGYNGYIRYGSTTGPTGFNITGITGTIGLSTIAYGDQGPQGPTGPTGFSIIGVQGPQGPQGYSYQGPTGHQGPAGEGYTGPTGMNISYSSISDTFNGTSSSSNQDILTISLNQPYYVQWYIELTSISVSNVVTIYFGFDQDVQLIPLTGTTSISGSGNYSSDIVFQCYYNGNTSDTFTINYQIGYVQLFNNL